MPIAMHPIVGDGVSRQLATEFVRDHTKSLPPLN